MPTDSCVIFHQCTECRAELRPKAGDCCVFCSYSSVPCPPVQLGEDCCDNCGPQPEESDEREGSY
jgi:hypothetical protein